MRKRFMSFSCVTCGEDFETPQGSNGTHITTKDGEICCCFPCQTHWDALPSFRAHCSICGVQGHKSPTCPQKNSKFVCPCGNYETDSKASYYQHKEHCNH